MLASALWSHYRWSRDGGFKFDSLEVGCEWRRLTQQGAQNKSSTRTKDTGCIVEVGATGIKCYDAIWMTRYWAFRLSCPKVVVVVVVVVVVGGGHEMARATKAWARWSQRPHSAVTPNNANHTTGWA
jgi:hypothetical protein